MFNIFKRKKEKKVFVIGLDCADPHLVFEQWYHDLPNFRRLIDNGAYGKLKSAIPCITVPAWSSMLSSTDPGTLGFYGFRNRADYSYKNMTIATGAAVKQKRVWDYIADAGKESIVVGVPQTYPVKPVKGHLISSFLTPSIHKQYTYPNELRYEIDQVLEGTEYDVDVREFRTKNKDYLLEQIYLMTQKRFKVLNYLQTEKPWDFFMWVEMGVDRIHHAFWQFHDPEHHRHQPHNKFLHAIKEYYQYIDREIGPMLDRLDEDTIVLIVSDHGVKRMDGGFCLNQWLSQEGYLVFKEPLPTTNQLIRFEDLEVDWERTTAWGAGGYYGRLFLNVQGREPNGTISQGDYEAKRNEIIAKIENLVDHQNKPMHNICYRPEEIYKNVNNIAPDLILYFGDLHWRSVGSLGHPDIYTFENDTGPDDANHAQDGLIIYYDPKQNLKGKEINNAQLMDIAPTILKNMGISIPQHMQGNPLEL